MNSMTRCSFTAVQFRTLRVPKRKKQKKYSCSQVVNTVLSLTKFLRRFGAHFRAGKVEFRPIIPVGVSWRLPNVSITER